MVADLMSRPPQAVPVSGSATAASVKVPSGSLAASQEKGSTAWAPHHHAAAVTAVDVVDLQAAEDVLYIISASDLHSGGGGMWWPGIREMRQGEIREINYIVPVCF